MPGRLIIVFGFVFLVDLLQGQEMVLMPIQDTLSRELGSSMVLTCSVSLTGSESKSTNISLHFIDPTNKEVEAEIGRVYVLIKNETVKKLYVTNITESDAGTYRCQGTVAEVLLDKGIELKVYKAITFDDAPSVQNPAIDTDALIKCIVSASPDPPVTAWLYEGQRIYEEERRVKEADGLRIHGIKESDNGNYTCRPETKDGLVEVRNIEVIVHIPPKITQSLKDEVGVQGKNLSMSCKASGLPSPLYEFFINESLIVSTDRIQVDNSTGDIHFRPLDRLDAGRYKCRAFNSAGFQSTTGELRVLIPPVIDQLNDIIVSEGDTAIIECRSHGDPVPEVTFHRVNPRHDYVIGENDNGQVIVTSPADGQIVVSINNTDRNYSGNFTCQARNSAGSDNRVVTIKVEFRPQFHDNQTVTVYIWANKTRNMTCRVSSEPEATIEWLRRGTVLTTNETYEMYKLGDTSYLQVRVRESDQSWIYGEYVCRASNKLGQVETVIDLQRALQPDAPESVGLVEALPTAVILRASPPKEDGGEKVLGFRVGYDDKVQDFSLGDVIRIGNLKPSTAYVFLVRARNEVGSGRALEVNATTVASA